MSALKLARLLLAALLLAAGAAQAGGPLQVCAPGVFATYPSHSVSLNYDGGGTLGARTKAQADAIVNNAIGLWTNVPTATISLTRGPDLPVDVTVANYLTYYSDNTHHHFGDGLNPVIYDTDGSITDDIFGVGNSNGVLGFAGSASNGSCQYVEGQAVINGKIAVSDTTMTVVLAHELGHFIGLDHTQLDTAQGLSLGNYPLMYPIAVRGSATLGDDDISAITSLYPDTNVAANYGTLQGNFRRADGVTQVPGANIWAKENTSGKVYSVVSDYLEQSNGFFKMLLPPGTYTLHAGAIYADDPLNNSSFTGGSSVGPYSEDLTGASFQPPLYSLANGAGTPLNLTMGNGTPQQIVITAGCVATADFRVNGAGLITGNCAGVTPPADPVRLANLSTRMQVQTGNNVMIGGFIIGGSTPKTVAITATGPSLVPFGITNPLSNPTLTLVRSSDQAIIATNDNWQTDPGAPTLQANGFAPSSPLESGLVATLQPGAYTAIVSGVSGVTGVGVVGVFEVDHPEAPLINISTRGEVLTGNDVMIGGFIVQGSGPQTVVITGTGPSLASFGIANPLANPTLTLVRSSDQATLATNDDWQASPDAASIQALGFAPSDPHESAIKATLQPGAYTAILTGVGGGTGVGVIGVFTTP